VVKSGANDNEPYPIETVLDRQKTVDDSTRY
jgi:hypothetical protein